MINNAEEFNKKVAESKPYGPLGYDTDYSDWLLTYFCSKHAGQKQLKYEETCNFKSGDIEEFVSKLNKHFNSEAVFERVKKVTDFCYTDLENYFCYFSIGHADKELKVSYSAYFTDRAKLNSFKEFIKSVLVKEKKTDSVYVISSTSNGLALNPLGALKYNFIDDNYESHVLKGYRHIVTEFSKEQPYGRLSIINGIPGSGKTNIVKGIVSSLKNCTTILLPSKFVGDIDGPNIVALLTQERSNQFEFDSDSGNIANSILFIIEDADECLVPRGAGNVSLISSLLNYTDGIFGSMLDLRILATTNAEKVEFDEALLRPGRLCRHIEVGKLTAEKASSVYKRISGGKEKEYKVATTLAEVYSDVNGTFQEAEVSKSVIGFA